MLAMGERRVNVGYERQGGKRADDERVGSRGCIRPGLANGNATTVLLQSASVHAFPLPSVSRKPILCRLLPVIPYEVGETLAGTFYSGVDPSHQRRPVVSCNGCIKSPQKSIGLDNSTQARSSVRFNSLKLHPKFLISPFSEKTRELWYHGFDNYMTFGP
jgi:hypothetical protein